MDAEGLDLAVLFPSRGLFVLGLDSSEAIGSRRARAALRHGHRPRLQRLLADLLRPTPPTACSARRWSRPHDVPGAVLEARRCVEELGFKAVFLSPGCVNRRPWHHPAYDPLWAEIQRLDVPITFHGGGQTYLTPDFSLQVLDSLMLWHTFNQPLAIQFVHREPVRRRRARALPPDLRVGAARGQLLVGAVAARTASTSTTSGSAGSTRPTSP